jgi:hypothetical protein
VVGGKAVGAGKRKAAAAGGGGKGGAGTLGACAVSKWSCVSAAGGSPPLGYPAGRVV